MKIELQRKEPQKADFILPRRENAKLSFVDNRSQTVNQTKFIKSIQKKDNAFFNNHVNKIVLQRFVGTDITPNTPLYINDPQHQFHGEAVKTIEYKFPNQYVVGLLKIAHICLMRCDQLVTSKGELEKPSKHRIDIGTINSKSVEELTQDIDNIMNTDFGIANYTIGGSFATYIYSRSVPSNRQEAPARTPCDIDIIVSKQDFKKLSSNITGVFPTGKFYCGLEIEIHRSEAHGNLDDSKLSPINDLLSNELVKIRDKSFKFQLIIPSPEDAKKENMNASDILALMKGANNDLMKPKENSATNDSIHSNSAFPIPIFEDIEDPVEEDSNKVWIKSLISIGSLIDSGATLDAYYEVDSDW